MKILQINKFFYLKGGSERHYFDLIDLLKKNGHSVVEFSMKSKENYSSKFEKYFVDYVDLHKFNLKNIFKFFYNYQAVARLKKLIKKEKPNIAHLHNIAHQLSPAIIKVLKKHKIPIVQTLHDYKLICPNAKLFANGKHCEACLGGRYYHCFLNKCVHNSRSKSFLATLEAYFYSFLKVYDLVDVFIAPSFYMKETAIRFGVPKEKIKVLHNFVNIKKAEKNKSQKDYLLYFGRLEPEKGLDFLIEALKITKNKHKLKIAGEGSEKEKIQKENLDNVELCGYKKGKELENLIKQAKAVIIPSIWAENMPYSMLEAMAMGSVLIVAKTGGLAEIIQNKKNGFLFKSDNAKELAKIIDGLDDFDLGKIKENAYKTVNKMNSESYYQELNKIYSAL